MFGDKNVDIPSLSTGGIVAEPSGSVLEQAGAVLKNALSPKTTLPTPDKSPLEGVVLSGTSEKLPKSGLPPEATKPNKQEPKMMKPGMGVLRRN